MYAILQNHLLHLKHQPFAFIGMIAMTIFFGSILGSSQLQTNSEINVPIFSKEYTEEKLVQIADLLNSNEEYHFEAINQNKLDELIEKNVIDMAVELKSTSFSLIVAAETADVSFVEAHLYTNLNKIKTVQEAASKLGISTNDLIQQLQEEAILYPIQETNFQEDSFIYDQSLQSLFGFALFFVFYTVSFTISTIIQQKTSGVWNRLLLSPLSKVQMYLGHILFTLMLGYLQLIIIFAIFHYVLGVNFYGGFWKSLIVIIPFLFAIVSLGIFISAFVKNPRLLNGLIPLLSVSMAMIGGAYWPIEIVQSKVMLALSKIVPLFYGMELLKGATYLNWSIDQFLLPISILFTFGVICMGVGINLMERRGAQ